MCPISSQRLRKGYTQFDGEKATFKPIRVFAVWHIICFYAVCMEFFSELFSVSGIGAYGVLSCGVLSASVVSSGCAAGTGDAAV